jgi:hypothetical protein
MREHHLYLNTTSSSSSSISSIPLPVRPLAFPPFAFCCWFDPALPAFPLFWLPPLFFCSSCSCISFLRALASFSFWSSLIWISFFFLTILSLVKSSRSNSSSSLLYEKTTIATNKRSYQKHTTIIQSAPVNVINRRGNFRKRDIF